MHRNEAVAPNSHLEFSAAPTVPEWIWEGNKEVPVRVEAFDDENRRAYCRVFEWDELRREVDVRLVTGTLEC